MTSRTMLRRMLPAPTLIPAAFLLAACASNGSSAPAGALLPQSQAAKAAPGSVRPNSCTDNFRKNLFVSSGSENEVLGFCNEYYVQDATITNGVNSPGGVDVDAYGNLYVANFNTGSGGSVTEYQPSNGNTPFFTYSSGMAGPEAVTVDVHGNVFEGDFNADTVNEYPQTVNSASASCHVGGAVLGLAVDTASDVFVSYVIQGGNGNTFIGEYKGGLAGCNLTTFSPQFGEAYGIAIDKKRNLLVANGSQVDVVDPPYTSISGTLGPGFNSASGVSLNKKNTLAFVADAGTGDVWVLSYPGGTSQDVITGLPLPQFVVDAPNAVY